MDAILSEARDLDELLNAWTKVGAGVLLRSKIARLDEPFWGWSVKAAFDIVADRYANVQAGTEERRGMAARLEARWANIVSMDDDRLFQLMRMASDPSTKFESIMAFAGRVELRQTRGWHIRLPTGAGDYEAPKHYELVSTGEAAPFPGEDGHEA